MSTVTADQLYQTNLPILPSSKSSLPEYVPPSYIEAKLHEMGSTYFQDKNTAYAELRIEGIDKSFWIHKEYLELQSIYFNKILGQVGEGDMIIISLPSPSTFEPILEYLYTGDGDKLYDFLNSDNCYEFWKNIDFLGLENKIRAIIFAFIQNEINNDF